MSQLEIRVLAYSAQDIILISEFENGADIHTRNCRAWKGREDITPDERRAAKAMSFQLTYGAGAFRMEQTLGIPKEDARAFINEFYDKYKDIKEWQDRMMEQVKQNGYCGESWLQTVSGRKLHFQEGISPKFMQDRGIMTSYKPTDVKNYPIQSLAADILIIQRGVLFRKALEHRDKFLIVNTVHDSIMLDCKEEYVTMACSLLKEVMEDTTEINKVLTHEFNVPLKADISYGPSWSDMKEVE